MAKKSKDTKIQHESDKVLKITTPSWFGSHENMIVLDGRNLEFVGTVSEEEKNRIVECFDVIGPNDVILRDDRGFYLTERKRLDTGTADPNRYNGRKYD